MEQLKHVIVVDDFFDNLEAHVVELKSGLKQLLLRLSTDIGHARLGPVLILLTIRPVEGRLVVVPQFLLDQGVLVVGARSDDLALQVIGDESVLHIEVLSDVVRAVNKPEDESRDTSSTTTAVDAPKASLETCL